MAEKTIQLSVTDTGAVAGSDALQTLAFQQALDRVFLAGGGTVVVPAGQYRIGSIRLRSHTTLYLQSGAELLGSRDPEDYQRNWDEDIEPVPEAYRTDKPYEPRVKGVKRNFEFMLCATGRWNNGMIRAVCAENVAIIGEPGSVIDGRNCYDAIGEEKYRGPHGISMHHCRNIYLSGYTIRNTGNWAHSIFFSDNIEYSHVTALAGHDGIHVTKCHNVTIHDSEFYTGDDCVAGFSNINVLVENCQINTACSGMRFGGTNVLVKNCHFFGPARYFFRGSLSLEDKIKGGEPKVGRKNMLSVFTYYADFSVDIPEEPGNIIIRDCQVENVDRFLHYNFSGNETWQANRPLRDVTFENIHATGISMPLTAYGSPELAVSLTLRNVDFAFAEDKKDIPFIHTAYPEIIRLSHVTVRGKESGPFIKCWTPEAKIQQEQVSGLTEECSQVLFTDEPFVCKAI